MPVPQHPQMSRLGLLAAAFSDGSVVLYALPHPGALQSCTRTQVKGRKSHAALIPLCPEFWEAWSWSVAAAALKQSCVFLAPGWQLHVVAGIGAPIRSGAAQWSL